MTLSGVVRLPVRRSMCFETEPPLESPLLSLDNVIVTPHLGASTVEAQKNVAISVAKQCIEVLNGGSAKYVVNAPIVPSEQAEVLEPFAELAEKMGRFAIQTVEGRLASVRVHLWRGALRLCGKHEVCDPAGAQRACSTRSSRRRSILSTPSLSQRSAGSR